MCGWREWWSVRSLCWMCGSSPSGTTVLCLPVLKLGLGLGFILVLALTPSPDVAADAPVLPVLFKLGTGLWSVLGASCEPEPPGETA